MPPSDADFTLVRALLALAGDTDQMMRRYDEFFTEDVSWLPAMVGAVEGDEYQGREGIARYWEDFGASFRSIELRDVAIEAVGEGLVRASCRVTLHGRESGVTLEQDLGYLFRFENGRIAEGRSFFSPEEAAAAAKEQLDAA